MVITAEGVGAGCAVLALLGTAFGVYLSVVDRRQSKEIEAIEKAAKETKEDLEKRLDGTNAAAKQTARDMEADRRALEKRIGDLERQAITRADHAQFRAEILLTVDKVGERIEKSLDKFTAEIKEDMRVMSKRVDGVEARS